jgi:rhodanese-related sulfurtransferase
MHPVDEISAPELAEALRGDEPPVLVDVRTVQERALASIEPSTHIGLERFVAAAPAEVPRDADVVVYCHSGMRSMQAAMWMSRNGWTRVRNLAGGIDAWSVTVDPEMPRY